MKILALDPSTHCGFAHSSGPCGTFDLSIRRDESKGMRFIRLVGKLNDILRAVGVDVLVYEAARHAGMKMIGALVVQAELQGVIVHWCEENKLEYRGYSPSEIKKHATGSGNANKELMLRSAIHRWPDKDIPDDNTADALWLLDLATHQYGAATNPKTVE